MRDQNRMLESKWHEISVNGEIGCEIRLVIGKVGSMIEVRIFLVLRSHTTTCESSAAETKIQGISGLKTKLRTRSLCSNKVVIVFFLISCTLTALSKLPVATILSNTGCQTSDKIRAVLPVNLPSIC